MTEGTRGPVVLGVGNALYGDDGFGTEAVAAFARRYVTEPAVEVVDGGTEGLALLGYIEDASELLLFDAVITADPPGTVVELDGAALAGGAPLKLSQHQVGIEEVLGLAAWRDALPKRMVLIGAVPERLGLGPGLSPSLAAALPRALARAAAVLQGWGIRVEERAEGERT